MKTIVRMSIDIIDIIIDIKHKHKIFNFKFFLFKSIHFINCYEN